MPKIPKQFFDELGPERTAGMWAAPKAHGRMPEQSYDADPGRLNAALRLLTAIVPPVSGVTSVVDLGCMYGAYAIEFAKAGYRTTGIEAREQSVFMAKQNARKAGVQVKFIKDDVRTADAHGVWHAAWCCGLLYHLDQPASFLHTLRRATRKLVIIQTHVSLNGGEENEGYEGHWYVEGDLKHPFSAVDNTRSFWLTKPSLTQAIQEAGFPLVVEVIDHSADIKGSADRVMVAGIRP